MSDQSPDRSGGPSFFADCMLGRLARWLRAVGLDTLYERAIDDDELLRRCHESGRILLTRDTELARRGERKGVGTLLIDSEKSELQLRQVVDCFDIEIGHENLFSRCTHCNCAVIESPHPSPLSANRGFFGSRPFSRANGLLEQMGAEPIDWRLPSSA